MSVYDSLYELPPTDFSSLDIAFRNSITRPSVLMIQEKKNIVIITNQNEPI
jgi:hypothetical protein